MCGGVEKADAITRVHGGGDTETIQVPSWKSERTRLNRVDLRKRNKRTVCRPTAGFHLATKTTVPGYKRILV